MGLEVVDFMAELGRPLDPWQANAIIDCLGVRPDGLWSSFETVVLVSRQNGKGGITEARELGGVFLFKEPLMMHSSHQFKTSTAAFRRLQDIIDGSDWLTRRVKTISRSKGDESIQLTSAAGGGVIQFVARTLGSGRGLTGSTTVFDEAAWLTIGQYAAQTPTLATIPNPQIIYTSTPPDEDVGPMPEDAMLPSVRKRAARGERATLHEWSPVRGMYDRTDPAVWAACNPALGIRIAPWFLAQQLQAFTDAGKPEKFDTEHLGIWPADTEAQWVAFVEARWLDAWDETSVPVGRVAFGLDVSWDHSHAAVAAVGKNEAGGKHVELIKYEAGTGWVLDWLMERLRAWRPVALVVQPGSPGGLLLPDIRRRMQEAGLAAQVPLVEPGISALSQATGALLEGVQGRDEAARVIRLRGLPVLTASAAGAVLRKVGDAQVWDRKGASSDSAPVMAATLGLLGWLVHGARPVDVLSTVA